MSKSADRATERAARAAALMEKQRKDERRRRLAIVGAVAVVLAIVLGVGVWVQASRDTTGDVAADAPGSGASVAEGVPEAVTDDYGVLVGDPDAPTTITVYEDLQCPVCARFEAATGDALSAAIDEGRVQVEYRMVSFLDSQSANEYSSRALNALLATLDTAGVDAFKTVHDQLYADQPAEGTAGPEDDALVADAVAAGAEESEVRPLIEDKVYDQWIRNATDAMSRNGVNGTPTVFVNGQRAEGDPVVAVQDALGG